MCSFLKQNRKGVSFAKASRPVHAWSFFADSETCWVFDPLAFIRSSPTAGHHGLWRVLALSKQMLSGLGMDALMRTEAVAKEVNMVFAQML